MLQEGRDIYVISDLHLGDGGPRDNFAAVHGDNVSRPEQFHKFLDYVEKNEGQLLILGDLFELWQANFGKVLIHSVPILDRLAAMKAVYVVGNHDIDLEPFIKHNLLRHTFFEGMAAPFTHVMGGKSFHFMHGHEVDPVNNAETPGFGRILTIAAGFFEDANKSPYLPSGETVESTLLGVVEPIWDALKSKFAKIDKETAAKVSDQELTPRQKPSRVRGHFEQMRKHKDEEGYDYAVVGHTHEPGKFEGWYFNSGSWVCMKEGRTTNNFLRISTDGDVKVYDWDNDRAVLNEAIINV